METAIEKELYDILGDNHQMTSAETPMRKDAFLKSDEEKMKVIENHFYEIMHEMGMDMTDDSLKGTPHRVAKMFIKEIFSGLNPAAKPKISVFENSYHYDKMLVEANISFNSTCEHCQEEAKHVVENRQKLQSADVYFLSTENLQDIQNFAEKYQLHHFQVGQVKDEQVSVPMGIQTFPTCFVYSESGNFIKQFKGQVKMDVITDLF